jgi:thioredoxin-like negative regulator of GroEL
VHGLEQQYGDQVNFVYLDIDDSRTDAFQRQLGFRVQPHIFLLDGNGQVIQQWLGLVSEDELEAALNAAAS